MPITKPQPKPRRAPIDSITAEPLARQEADRQLWIMAAVLFTAALMIRVACFTGLIASVDDLAYSIYARQISQGIYHLEPNHYAIRYGVTVPLAAVYHLFGIREWTTVILPLISSSLAPVLLAVLAARFAGLGQAWIAGLLLATFPVDIRYATVLVPEPLLQTLVLAGVLLFLLAQAHDSMVLGITAGFVLGISYLTKEPGALVAAALTVFALLRRQWRLAVTVASGCALVVAAEFIWYWSQSGDLLFRFHAMGANDRSDMAKAANANLSYRLWKFYPRMMLIPSVDFGLHSLLALAASLVAWLWQRSTKVLLLLWWATLPFLYLNFGTTSFRRYWALPAAPRYIGLIYAPLFVLTAVVLIRWARGAIKKQIAVSVGVAVVCIAGVVCAASTRGTGYRTEHVKRLKAIATSTTRDDGHICGFSGPDAAIWRETLKIIAPGRLGCAGSLVVQIVPDARGLPTATLQPGTGSK